MLLDIIKKYLDRSLHFSIDIIFVNELIKPSLPLDNNKFPYFFTLNLLQLIIPLKKTTCPNSNLDELKD